MHLQDLAIYEFKNYEEAHFHFSPHINLITGENGSGKTNLLDAIYHICITKSAFESTDKQHIRLGSLYYILKAQMKQAEQTYEILCALQNGQKKQFTVNGVGYEKISQHIGRFPIVFITPYDDELIREGSEVRRTFFDTMLCQVDADYLESLSRYKNTLKQRNAALKQFAEQGRTDRELLGYYDQIILTEGASIAARRNVMIEQFSPFLQTDYAFLAQDEQVSIGYQSDFLHPQYKTLFGQALAKDLALQRTTMGVHRDDFIFQIEGQLLKKFGSQGQQKSFIIALKTAQFELMRSLKNHTPMLLLDDIFDKLDDNRIQQLVKMIDESRFGQIFITDARPERSRFFLENISKEKQIFQLQKKQASYENTPE
ncbi:MAG: DNA replication and repair protein RecF [Cytophagales bacterium]|nr:MAG: DNA replication and repair protein RecF [Cytophagales bacterium]